MKQAGLGGATYCRYVDCLNQADYTYIHRRGVAEEDMECNVTRVSLDTVDSTVRISTCSASEALLQEWEGQENRAL